MILRVSSLSLVAVLLTAANTFAISVDLSSLRYDFGIGAGSANFVVTDGVDGDVNDSYDATLSFDVANGGNNKHALTADVWPVVTDLTGFASLDLTIDVDPSSALDAFGNHGFMQVVVRNNDSYDYVPVSSFNLQTGTNVVSASLAGLDAARALTFDLYGGPSQDIDGDVIISVV
ncbi:MAG: hypothetical protein AAGF97_18750, partial [Planctomycetota bacterium]